MYCECARVPAAVGDLEHSRRIVSEPAEALAKADELICRRGRSRTAAMRGDSEQDGAYRTRVSPKKEAMENPAIRCCPRCGGYSLSWPTTKHFQCESCGFVLYLNIASAVAVIMECRGEVLFGVRKHDPGSGMLDLPGGFVDPGETAEEAVRREVMEELGIAVPEMRYLFSLPNRYPYRGMVYDTLDLIFLASFDKRPQVKAGDDLEDVIWVKGDSIEYERIAFGSLREGVRRYLAGL